MANDPRESDETLPQEELGGAQGVPSSAPRPENATSLPPHLPTHIGRYRVEGVIGKGGFGLVYLAHDDQLQRHVAIKVPHRELTWQPADTESYLAEARALARLDHPHIVPVLDVGTTAEFPCFFVSKYIDGTSLAHRMEQSPVSYAEAAELAAAVAEALHYAHKQGLIHRDIKPANILLDRGGKAYVVDFGLALKEAELGQGPHYAGTPAYMSPEQARGEGHRVDGRSDIYSLGAVLYRMLTGRHTFTADTREELLELIAMREPKPLRQIADRIPKELERICLKALSRRASDRYTTAKDMAEDLRHFLAGSEASQAAVPMAVEMEQPSGSDSRTSRADSATAVSDGQPIRIVPKGLRSFDEHDADFFLELLPGPRDRDGLPDSIRFWKTRIEETDADKTFSVGLIYGPSGCGKSSLVKAGLLPRLSEDVVPVYVEATGQETELRLLNGLRKACPHLPQDLDLKQTLTALRRGQGVPGGKKVLIVLDQFEQWLHANGEQEHGELVQALRQCDGGQGQCIVMVRDDFWLAVSRFMHELEIRLLEGQNSALVDLFDLDHARRILAAFGRAYGRLPESPSDLEPHQKDFLKQAIRGLAEEGKVVCVRLALFAEMMKGRAWVPAVLKQVGGAEGVGTTFLEETFSASTSPPEHRYHQKAVPAVLKALLPESGANIRGHMRSSAELLEASGYASRPRDFAELLHILDSELRLITPTDPEGVEGGNDLATPPRTGQKHYQLTHDYLVPSLRQWLTRKQRQTRRGRAELRLAERAAAWNAKPENRQLPSGWEYLQIRGLTPTKSWTAAQAKMMRVAGRYHILRAAAVLLVATLLGWAGWQSYGYVRADALLEALASAETRDVPGVVEQLGPSRRWADPALRAVLKDSPPDSKKHLHASLALLPIDSSQVDYLKQRLLMAAPQDVPVLRQSLRPYQDPWGAELWRVVQNAAGDQAPQTLAAASALALYDPTAKGWPTAAGRVTDALVSVNPVYLGPWMQNLAPVREHFLDPLSDIYRNRDGKRSESQRSLATDILADYAADHPERLADLVMSGKPSQFKTLFPKLQAHGPKAVELLKGELKRKLKADWQDPPLDPAWPKSDPKAVQQIQAAKEQLAQRQANAAAALLRMNVSDPVWPLLRHQPDPRMQTWLIHRLGPLGVNAELLAKRLLAETDVSIRRALILSLGEMEAQGHPGLASLPSTLRDFYRKDPDPGLHAAAEWLLRRWGRADEIGKIDSELATGKIEGGRQWYVNGQKQTLAVIRGPVEFEMGSPESEENRLSHETLHRRQIGRVYAIATKEVTVEQYKRFQPDFGHDQMHLCPEPSCPILGTSWHQAVQYCNWLSEQEGLAADQWCYVPNAAGRTAPDMKLAPDWLERTGYRLPTEAEWEYACRAGANTPYSYGQAQELLGSYAWYVETSNERSWPVGQLRPNGLGLFDMHGNVSEWCQDWYQSYSRAGLQQDDGATALGVGSYRVIRGGSWDYRAGYCRSAYRSRYAPDLRGPILGFRVARSVSGK